MRSTPPRGAPLKIQAEAADNRYTSVMQKLLSARSSHVAPWALAIVAVVAGALTVSAQSLSGSRASLQRQQNRAQVNDFTFLRTPAQVRRFVSAGLLVPVSGNRDYVLSDVSFNVARPAVKLFIDRLSGQYRRACGEPLVVTSLTRPVSSQPRNASAASVHPTGMAADLRRPAGRCRRWLESTLLSLERQNVLEATLERNPPHFHVAVFSKNYIDYVARLTNDTPQAGLTATAGDLSYTVRRADTLWEISRRYGTTPTAIRRANRLPSSTIHPGDVLKIPVESGG